jgi:hypothetical protein
MRLPSRGSSPTVPRILRGEARAWTAVVLLLVSRGTPAAAQESGGRPARPVYRLDLYLTTHDQWRGIRRNAHPVVQSDGMAGVAWGRVSLSAGGWTSLELGDTRSEPRPDLRSGRAGFSQTTLWGQAAYRSGSVTLTAGAIHDRYRRVGPDPSTTEVYGSARYQRGRWTGALSLWHAVDGAHGSYLEPRLAFHHFANPFAGPAVDWTTSLSAGFQLGQRDPDAASLPGPEDSGLTLIALGSAIRLAVNLAPRLALFARTGPELQISRDPAAKRGRNGGQADVRFWWPAQLGLSWPVEKRE